ncbi:DUF190 domain-containing protein [Mycobacterium sp. 852014-52144_SCH5372336]|uniref:DUF190 domain-containing protein n=1 Tax=Mycobacterium sp. 852014-52144_SCH5372336 TaxID=1834115 RepID=UPI000800278E|nr:DUF190 domain-containing protein [Mycobacterium sp. 852014-52144_SCH5372336]OBB72843.1 hypothetical protein A5759_17435 [Mycobacterium sp. 852014-52144_SCH5372336]
MNVDYLKLTTYFGERQRVGDRFLADALLDLYTDAGLATSAVLRGIAGFGPRHQVRTDRTLSMSEDPPIAVAAVDVTDKVAPLADRVAAMTSRGLVTLERARFTGGAAASAVALPETTKLTVYVGRQDRIAGRPAHRAICDTLHDLGFFGATVFLGVDGTCRGLRKRARFFSRNVDVPEMIIATGGAAQAQRAIEYLERELPAPLYTVERVQVCKRGGLLLARPPALPQTDTAGRQLWQKLMIHTSEATLHGRVPIHRALVRRLHEVEASGGATVLRGIWGFRGGQKPHGDRLIQAARQVPVTTIVVDSPARIAAAFDIVDELTTEDGLVTSELVPALVAIDGGERRGSLQLARYP